MSGLELALAAAALIAGLTGTWSPCGFSMVATIGPAGHPGGTRTTLAACLTFALGALAGGIVTFASLAWLGGLVHGAGGTVAYSLAALIALGAAVAEARGLPIVPQLRRQVPEHWRRVMPLPIAAALYGVLLGLGFTTFVLTFGVFALAAICFAVGEPGIGVAVGLAFGAGRAVPVIAIAPISDRPAGIAVTELMAGRPAILRGFRACDALALLAAAAALLVSVPASAAQLEQCRAADPAVADSGTVFQRPDRSGVLLAGGRELALPGHDPAIGGGRIAVVREGAVVILSVTDLSELATVPAEGADALAISKRWLVWRARNGGKDALRARKLRDPVRPGPVKALGTAGGAAQIGRPSIDGSRLVYARATGSDNVIVKRLLGAKRKKRAKSTLVRSRTEGLSNPSIRGKSLLYVRHTKRADRLKLASLGARGKRGGRTLLSRRRGTLWSTALGPKRAYVTQIAGTAPAQKLLSVKR